MASSTSAPSSSPGHQQGKDSNQQEALRSSWETAGHEALGLKAVPSSHVQSRHPHDKGTLVCGLQPLSLPVERSGQAGDEEAQQCKCQSTCLSHPELSLYMFWFTHMVLYLS